MADNSVTQKWKDLEEFLRDRLTAAPSRKIEWIADKNGWQRMEVEGDVKYTQSFTVQDEETRKWLGGNDLRLTVHWRERAWSEPWWINGIKVSLPAADRDTPGSAQPVLVFDTIHLGCSDAHHARCSDMRTYFTAATFETEYVFERNSTRPFVGYSLFEKAFGSERVFGSAKWLNRPGGMPVINHLVRMVQQTIASWHMSPEMVACCEDWLNSLDQPGGEDTVSVYLKSASGKQRTLTLQREELQSLELACGLGTNHSFFGETSNEITSFRDHDETHVLQLLLLCKFKENFDVGYNIRKLTFSYASTSADLEADAEFDILEVYKIAHEQQISEILLRKIEIYLVQHVLGTAKRNDWDEFCYWRNSIRLYELPVLKAAMRLIAQDYTWRGVNGEVVHRTLFEY
ncbi:uncharacterized protein LOC129597580 [Paramacrobiotus metropolitanus]|uniref:uncharacterized protein LOC129597580 n=1 Tax=Paramacrobiotus metropolitanus TaxID=2943436 RepID=UPI002446167D|nr:uncharacterized protein LOC129597580 [Paramacrobiotus metropolitanus]